jgi:three-Cys-motif partner protein
MTTSMREGAYDGREQTLVKHVVLEKYLQRFALIVGSWADTVSYVDGFSGPWNLRSEDFADSSFATAHRVLREAQAALLSRGRSLRLRCFFIEANAKSYQRLAQFASETKDAEVVTKNSGFVDAIPDIQAFLRGGGSSAFGFTFIDPTGWTGFAMRKIRPLLQHRHGEVLINFMTSHIRRFVESPEQQRREEFEELFGAADFLDELRGLTSPRDREDALVRRYMRSVREAGGFRHVCAAVVLHPEKDTAHFHLIYATRDLKGVEVFKEAERAAMKVMEEARAEAQQRKRQRKGQVELFGAPILHRSSYYEGLKERYTDTARQELVRLLRERRRVSYDKAWEAVLSTPLVWESDLKEWIREWQDQGIVVLEGLSGRERVPKLERRHFLAWNEA